MMQHLLSGLRQSSAPAKPKRLSTRADKRSRPYAVDRITRIEGGLMPHYNVYAGICEGGRFSPVYSFVAEDDEAAEKFVLDRLTEKPVELWCHARKVTRFEGTAGC